MVGQEESRPEVPPLETLLRARSTMDSEPKPIITSTRHKCVACYKQYKKKEHLVEHMRTFCHSVHQPRCGVCQKHCKSLESLREHLTGPLPKANCSSIFSEQGCDICLKVFDTPDSLSEHKETCRLSAPAPLGTTILPYADCQIDSDEKPAGRAIALDCEMVGGGSDGSLNICARVCLVDEDENLVFHTYVQPQIPVTDYRSEITGLSEEHFRDAMPLKEAQEKILEILYNGEGIGKLRLDGGNGRLLVGHDLEHDLECLKMNYPDHMLRDTAKYYPLMRTNLVGHSLKYLTRTYLGYDIQSGVHDPYEDSVSAMRLYKRMRDQDHQSEEIKISKAASITNRPLNTFGGFSSWLTIPELEKLSPEELYAISGSNYRCWCLDSRHVMHPLDN